MSNIIYDGLNTKGKKKYTIFPNKYRPTPTERDYEKGFIDRYFVRKFNDVDSEIIEVVDVEYQSIMKNPFWIGIKIKWNISYPLSVEEGENVIYYNKKEIEAGETVLPGLRYVLPNLIEFHKDGGFIKYDSRL